MAWLWSKFIKPVLEFVGHIETVGTIKSVLWPILFAGGTAVSGYLGAAPVMWIIMASTLTFMGASAGILTASMYLERKNPLNKIKVLGTIFPHDLAPMSQHNRQVRRGAAKERVVVQLPTRRIIKGQLGVEIANTAIFPISVIPYSSDTKLYGKQPPRAKYPKPSTLLQPGGIIWIHDEAIELNVQCGLLTGSIDIVIKYGMPGNERFTLTHRGTVEVFMEETGMLKVVYFHPMLSLPS
jgi:hypothetical protein